MGEDIMKLHLGCGKRYIEGWVHVDAVQHPHVDYIAMLDNLSFLDDESVQEIYACHVLEHFKRNEVKKFLSEWFRVMKKDSILRLAVPDFEKACQLYHQTKDIMLVKGLICGRQDYEFNFHYNVFDMKSISELLKEIGFSCVKKYDWRDTEHAHLDDYSQSYYPHLDKEHGMLLSLNIEAVK
tara:strand:+ start:464 stop:1009 length:546 start_codon:yes stop_codon:yes gene_type:complete